MHKILLAVLLMCSTAAYAEEPAKTPPAAGGKMMERPKENFDEFKAKRLEKIAEKKTCIQNAATAEALHSCWGKTVSLEEQKTKALERNAKIESCIKAATDFEAMKACHGRHGGGEGRKGGGRWGGRRGGGGGEGGGDGAPE